MAVEVRGLGSGAIVVPTDVSVPADCRRLAEATVEAFGRLDLLVNNAGISMLAPFGEVEDPETLARVMDVNYMGAVRCTHAALPQLAASGGRLVAVASLTALAGVPGRSGYAASKHAMAGFFDSLRIELASRGVSVTVAYPGFVDTGIRERAVGTGRGRGEGIAAGKMMAADECARRILEAAADRRREVRMTWRGALAPWLRLLAPRLVDRMAARAVGWPP
ncbi:MAG: SDR family oxidoreductase [Gemmatimonadota bacterium]